MDRRPISALRGLVVEKEGDIGTSTDIGSRASLTRRALELAGVASVLSVAWWAIAEGEPSAWVAGVPAIAVAMTVLARTGALGVPRFSPLGGARFAAFFVWTSMVGGVDVASRVLGPAIRIRTGVIRYRWQLPPGGLRVLAMATVSLQPGTLAVRDEGAVIAIHVLDHTMDLAGAMARLEQRIAAMARLDLGSSAAGP